MKRVASSDQELTVEERNLLSVAYKNVIGARRASWRIVSSIEQKEESKGNESQVTMIKKYREKIEAELAQICEDILDVLDKHLIPSAASGESKVFYHKMCVFGPLCMKRIHDFFSLTSSFSLQSTGRATITVTWLNLLLVTSARTLLTSLLKLTRLLLMLPSLNCRLPTLSDWDWHSTSVSSTMRFSTRPTVLVTWPSKPLTMLLLNSTHCRKKATRTALVSVPMLRLE